MLIVTVPALGENGRAAAAGTASSEASSEGLHVVALPGGWYRNAYTNRVGHTRAAAHYRALSRWLGGIAVILATVTGTTLVTNLADSPDPTRNRVAALLAALTAIAAAFQTFAGYDNLEAAHHKAAVSFSMLQREFDEIRASEGSLTSAQLDELGKAYNAADEAAPSLKNRDWRYADTYVRLHMAGEVDPSGRQAPPALDRH